MTAGTGVNPTHPSDIKIFDHQQKVVVLRPSIPTWVTLTPEGLSLLNLCTGTLTVQEIAERLNVDCKAVQQCIQSLQECNLLGEEEPVKAPSKALHNIWLHVTNACNLTCIICYQSSGSASPHELTVKEIYELLSYISRSITLDVGDLISTGTPAGVGIFTKERKLLKPGDEVICEIEKIGRLKNKVVSL